MIMKIFIHVNALTEGGAERVASLWATEFAERGHDVTVIIRNDGRPVTYAPGERYVWCVSGLIKAIRFQST